jgi:hypothetical protein
MNNVPNENILKLRELTDKLCTMPDETVGTMREIKSVIKENEEILKVTKSDRKKIKCYEVLFDKIKSILNCNN